MTQSKERPEAMSDYKLLERLVPDLDLRLAREQEIRMEIHRRVMSDQGFQPFLWWRRYV